MQIAGQADALMSLLSATTLMIAGAAEAGQAVRQEQGNEWTNAEKLFTLAGVIVGAGLTLIGQRITRGQAYASGRASTYGQLLRVLEDYADEKAQVAEPDRVYSEMWHKVVDEHHPSKAKQIVAGDLPRRLDDAAAKVVSDKELIPRLREAIPKDTGRHKGFLPGLLRQPR